MSSSSVPFYLGDQYLTQETRDLISSLPKEKGFLVSEMYQYQGIWYPQAFLQGVLNCQKLFEAKDSDIILITNPKSGTTWLKALVFSLLNRHNFPLSNSTGDHPLRVTHPHDLIPLFLEGVYYNPPDFDFSGLPSPRVMNTHMPHVSLPESVKSSSCKIVYCFRNPKDMFVSLWHFGKKVAPEETVNYPIEKAVEAFCKGRFISGPFWDHVLDYWYASHENPNKVLFVTYEDLKKQTEVEMKRIAEFLGCGFINEEEMREIVRLCSFESLSNMKVNKEGKVKSGVDGKAFFRKGEVGGWRDTLSESLAREIDRAIEEKFQGSGLKISS